MDFSAGRREGKKAVISSCCWREETSSQKPAAIGSTFE
jgi:hypothetical protein